MTQIVNQENMQATYLSGRKIVCDGHMIEMLKVLFDGYLIIAIYSFLNTLKISTILFDGYLMKLNFNNQ